MIKNGSEMVMIKDGSEMVMLKDSSEVKKLQRHRGAVWRKRKKHYSSCSSLR